MKGCMGIFRVLKHSLQWQNATVQLVTAVLVDVALVVSVNALVVKVVPILLKVV
jgi:hypothetical protein